MSLSNEELWRRADPSRGADGGEEAASLEAAAWTPLADPCATATPPPLPEFLRANEGALFYPGMRHLLSSEPEHLKTWMAAAATAELLMVSKTVLWWDADAMGLAALIERLEALGATREAIRLHLLYVAPELPLRDAGREVLLRVIESRPIALAVVDALNPALELQGLDMNSTADVQRFLREVVGLFHNAGIATLLIDHVAKNRDTRGAWAYGSERKVGGVDVHLSVELVGEPPTRERPQGRAVIKAQKDRPGWHRRGPNKRIGEFVLDTSQSPAWRLELTPEFRGPLAAGADEFRPTQLMERVSRHLEMSGSAMSKSVIAREVEGKAAYLRQAVEVLVREGYLLAEEGRQRGACLYVSSRPFRRADDEALDGQPRPDPVPADSDSPRPTRSRPRPDADADGQGVLGDPVPPGPTPSRAVAVNPVPPVPPPTGGDGVRGRTRARGGDVVLRSLPEAVDDAELGRFEALAGAATDPAATAEGDA